MNSSIQIPSALRSVLLIGDAQAKLESVRNMVRGLGLTVTGCCQCPDQCVAEIRRNKPDLCLVIIENENDSWQAAISAISRNMQVPVVVVACAQNHAFAEKTAQAGALALVRPDLAESELAAHLTIAWARWCDLAELGAKVDALNQRLEDRKIIERAKWILVERLNVDEESALRRLQKQARDHRRTLVDVAQGMLDSAELLRSDDRCRSAG